MRGTPPGKLGRRGSSDSLYAFGHVITAHRWSVTMAKGQQRSNKEARKPKKAKVKTIAANPSQKGGQRGLENLKNS